MQIDSARLEDDNSCDDAMRGNNGVWLSVSVQSRRLGKWCMNVVGRISEAKVQEC
jgi:hypothetical protein